MNLTDWKRCDVVEQWDIKDMSDKTTTARVVRSATVFVKNNEITCSFITKSSVYDIDDWAFLKIVATKIEELSKQIKEKADKDNSEQFTKQPSDATK